MKRVLFTGLALTALSLGFSMTPAFADEDDGSKITITSPEDGAKVGDTFELKYDLVKGSKAAHAHVYLDGETGLAVGDRASVTVEASDEYDLWASVTKPAAAIAPEPARAPTPMQRHTP